MRVAVTGGAGFIGSHVADAFLARGDEVLVVDDLSSGVQGNVPDAARFERLDIVDADALARALDGFAPELICHLAAQASVVVSVEDPARDAQVNVLGTLNVCNRDATVIYASTGGAAYGDGAPLPTPETYAPRPMSPYGASKLAGEHYVATLGRLHGRPNVSLRLANVYGPRQSPHGEGGVVAIFSDRLLRGERPQLRGGGTPTRDYVFVEDVARAFVLAAGAGKPGTFNVGTGRETSTTRLLELLQAAAGTSLEPEQAPLKPGEAQSSALDAAAIERELGWRPEVELEDGLRRTVSSYS